jgi:hypothetical protein
MYNILLVALLASALDIVAAWVLKHVVVNPVARIAVALAPVPGNVWLIVAIVRGVRKLDEFQKRLHFEAVVVAFLATGVAVFIYGYLQHADAVGPLNTSMIWVFMSFAYAIGYCITARHYR